jgi:cysteinyl-tRNA synthetase
MMSQDAVSRLVKGTIWVYNTLSRKKEMFIPIDPPLVRMYVCGPTVYDYMHIGHARTFVVFDGIKRYLRLRGYDVIHVQNITDIDDKIINKAKEKGVPWYEISEYFIKDYFDNLKKLNVHVDYSPRVTQHIEDIIKFIELLIKKGYAYVAESGSVYFDVDKYKFYGELSGRKSKDMWRQEEEVVSEKKNPYDFALWKAAKPGEPWWESPWGRGRPGWHIECSVMSSKFLGSQIDIHGGGQDLIFPHHENEKAQSEAALGVRPWVKYWLHSGMLTIKGEKMSKSLGNIIPLKDLFRSWNPKVVRLWLLSAHYRTQLDFSEEALEASSRLLDRFERASQIVVRMAKSLEPAYNIKDKDLKIIRRVEKILLDFHKYMSDDFNFAGATSALNDLLSLIFSEVSYTENSSVIMLTLKALNDMNEVFGVVDEFLKEFRTEERISLEDLVDLIVEVRSELRRLKMYELSDKIRSRLRELGIVLLDKKDKTEWFIKRN